MFRSLIVLLCAAASVMAADDIESQIEAPAGRLCVITEQYAADPVSSEQAFYQGAIPGLLRRLDPHSVFFDSDQFEQVKKMEASTQKGFGSVVSLLPGRVIVLQTTPGTPSARSGLAPGDEIVAINGYVIGQLDLEQLQQLLTQSRQQQAQLEVHGVPARREFSRFVLTPEDMQRPPAWSAPSSLRAGIGYPPLPDFDEKTGADLKQAIEKLGGEHLAGLVLDLRNNPGGVVTAALETASLFLRPGRNIHTLRGRSVPEITELVPATATPYGFKLAILVNEKSASASEIVTGAMQDHDRATIIGEPSFGKGLVQNVFPMSQNTGLALTVAFYYTPSGRSIQKPLNAEQFALGATTAHPNTQSEFRTDKGRPVTGGGGIRPDFVVFPQASNRLRAVLDYSGSFTNFATEFLRKNKIDEDFEVTPSLLDEFYAFVAERNIQPRLTEWLAEREFISSRLKTEIFNQALGVEKGDQVELQRDPVVQKALEVVGG